MHHTMPAPMFSYDFAYPIAQQFATEIAPVCERVEIVGSLRRNRPLVHDIDIIAMPRFIDIPDQNIFRESLKQNLLDLKLSNLFQSGWFTVHANGPKVKRFLKQVGEQSIPIDLYIATPETWWTLMLIRTGSRSHNMGLASRALRLNMHLKADGSGLVNPHGSLMLIKSEQEIFRMLGLPYRLPEQRE